MFTQRSSTSWSCLLGQVGLLGVAPHVLGLKLPVPRHLPLKRGRNMPLVEDRHAHPSRIRSCKPLEHAERVLVKNTYPGGHVSEPQALVSRQNQ